MVFIRGPHPEASIWRHFRGAGDGFTFTLHSGANTLTCSVNAIGAATCPGSLAVTAGDLVYLEEANTGPTAPGNSSDFQWGATFTSP